MDVPLTRAAVTAASVLSVVALSACASITVNSFVERGFDPGRYHSYAWAPADARPTGDPRLDNNPFVDARVRADVERALAGRGFEKTASTMADLLVHYHASITQKIDVRDRPGESAYCVQSDCGPFVYDAGSLVVDLIDSRTNQLVWRGWAEDSVDGVIDDQRYMERRIDDAVTRIMKRLPPRL